MNKIQFDINNKIDFIREGEELGTSLVQDWREDSFLVSIPLKGYRKKLLIVGEWITGFYYDAKKRVYMFQSRVLGRVIQNIPMYRLSIPETLYKVQRRDYVRVPITIPIVYAKISPEGTGSAGDVSAHGPLPSAGKGKASPVLWENATVLDLSGGGMNLSADNPLEPEQQIWIQIDTEGLKMKAKGKVVRCRARRISDLKTYSMGIKFIDITERDRDRIIRFVFKKLTDMRKKVLNDECGI